MYVYTTYYASTGDNDRLYSFHLWKDKELPYGNAKVGGISPAMPAVNWTFMSRAQRGSKGLRNEPRSLTLTVEAETMGADKLTKGAHRNMR